MPNFVKVDSKPFHPDTYVGPEHEEDFLGGTHERDMGIKLRVENTVRCIGSQTRILSDGRMVP